MTVHRRTAAIATLGLFLLLATACSDSTVPNTIGGGGSPFEPVVLDPAHNLAATHLTIAIHDAPAAEVREAWVTFAGASVHAVGGEWVAVAGRFPTTVDLLTLVNGRSLVLADSEVPAGTYDAVRFDITAASVVDGDGVAHDVSLPGGGVSVEHAVGFTCAAGEPLIVTLDFQVAPSFRIAEGGVAFKPTIVTDTVRVAP